MSLLFPSLGLPRSLLQFALAVAFLLLRCSRSCSCVVNQFGGITASVSFLAVFTWFRALCRFFLVAAHAFFRHWSHFHVSLVLLFRLWDSSRVLRLWLFSRAPQNMSYGVFLRVVPAQQVAGFPPDFFAVRAPWVRAVWLLRAFVLCVAGPSPSLSARCVLFCGLSFFVFLVPFGLALLLAPGCLRLLPLSSGCAVSCFPALLGSPPVLSLPLCARVLRFLCRLGFPAYPSRARPVPSPLGLVCCRSGPVLLSSSALLLLRAGLVVCSGVGAVPGLFFAFSPELMACPLLDCLGVVRWSGACFSPSFCSFSFFGYCGFRSAPHPPPPPSSQASTSPPTRYPIPRFLLSRLAPLCPLSAVPGFWRSSVVEFSSLSSILSLGLSCASHPSLSLPAGLRVPLAFVRGACLCCVWFVPLCSFFLRLWTRLVRTSRFPSAASHCCWVAPSRHHHFFLGYLAGLPLFSVSLWSRSLSSLVVHLIAFSAFSVRSLTATCSS